jgi:hypothetical protein
MRFVSRSDRVDLRQFEPFVPRKLYQAPEAMLIGVAAVCSAPFIALFVILRRHGKYMVGTSCID